MVDPGAEPSLWSILEQARTLIMVDPGAGRETRTLIMVDPGAAAIPQHPLITVHPGDVCTTEGS